MKALGLSIACHITAALLLRAVETPHTRALQSIAVGIERRTARSAWAPAGANASPRPSNSALQAPSPPASDNGASAAGATDAYIREVHSRLAAKKHYPLAAKSLGHEGVVTVSFFMNADGSASSIAVTRSSGHSTLDQSAVDLVHATAPFPPLPLLLTPGPLPLTLPITYSLSH